MTDATQPMAPAAVRIDVISDVVCPWCFIGKRRLDQALDAMPDIAASVYFRPFQLDPTIPRGGTPRAEYMARKFGDRLKDNYARLEQMGAEVGIPFAFDKIKTSPNTLDAHRLLRWAQTVGAQGEVAERLFQLYFIEGGDIGDADTLADVGAAHGLEKPVLQRLLAGDADRDAVRGEIEQASRMGVNGVPFFIFDSRIGVSGAHPAQTLMQAIRQSVAESAARTA